MSEVHLKEFKGFSGSSITLIKNNQLLFVRKQGQIERNVERYQAIKNYCNVPAIYDYDHKKLDLEYIQGLDIKQYLQRKNPDFLINFLTITFDKFASTSKIEKDYTDIYYSKLAWIDDSDLGLSTKEFIDRLPKRLPQSLYHGDMTLDNIIYSTVKNDFYLIDPLTSEYDSYIFDLAKLRQDTECKWFARFDDRYFDVQLENIQNKVFSGLGLEYNNYLLILMLLRVYPYCNTNSFEKQFIKREIKRLWK